MKCYLRCFAAVSLAVLPLNCFSVTLVKNSDFEEVRSQGTPPGWSGYAPHEAVTFGSDSSLAHSGTHSATVETTSDQVGVLVSDAVPVAPGETLHLSCWMRAKDLSTSSGGMLSLSTGYLDRYGSYFRWSRNRFAVPPIANSGEWFPVEYTVTVPERAAKATLQAGMRFVTGKLWVDELELTTSKSVALRFDMQGTTFEPGSTTLPMVLIDRAGGGHQLQLEAQPGSASMTVESGRGETSLTVPFKFDRRGKVTARVKVSAAGSDIETSLTGTVPPLLVADPLIPTHWVIEDAQTPALESRFYISEPADSRAQLSARAILIDANGKSLADTIVSAPLQEINTFRITAPNNVTAPTTYTLRLLIERNGKEAATAQLPWRFIHADETRVTMGEDGYPCVKGKPFFPIGMYMAGAHTDLKEAGFNVVQTYNAFAVEQGERPNNQAILQFLDNAYSNGMKALVYVNHGLATRLGREESLRRIRMFRNHPAMLMWYEEEAVARGLKPLSWLEELVGDMRREGPGHPVALGDLVDYGIRVKDRSQMLPADLMDAGIWWWYPTPPRNAPIIEDYEGDNAGPALEYVPPSFLTQAKTRKPLWVALQCYKKPDTADARYPTPQEYRCQAYLSVAAGAKGLFYYTGYGEQGGGILSHPEEGHWEELKALVHELRGMEDVFMSPDAQKPATSNEKMLSLKTKQLAAGNRVVIAVNRCNRTLHPRIDVNTSATKSAQVLAENRRSAISGGEINDDFKPYAVHVYQLGY